LKSKMHSTTTTITRSGLNVRRMKGNARATIASRPRKAKRRQLRCRRSSRTGSTAMIVPAISSRQGKSVCHSDLLATDGAGRGTNRSLVPWETVPGVAEATAGSSVTVASKAESDNSSKPQRQQFCCSSLLLQPHLGQRMLSPRIAVICLHQEPQTGQQTGRQRW